jgi:hypothetical protein
MKTCLLITVLGFCILHWLCAPSFFTFDSYDYLELSVNPVLGASHSFGFGYLLRGMVWLSRILGMQNVFPLYYFFNSVAAASLFAWCFYGVHGKGQNLRSSPMKMGFIIFLSLTSILFVIPGLLYLMNSVWSELAAFLQLSLYALILQQLCTSRRSSLVLIVASIILTITAYHVRYQMILAPLAFIAVALLLGIRAFFFNSLARAKKLIGSIALAGILSIVGLKVVNHVIGNYMPVSSVATEMTPGGMFLSFQCTFRCEMPMFKTDCTTAEGRDIIQNSRCAELLFGLKPLGPPRIPASLPLSSILYQIGPKKVLQWVLLAPLNYLKDIHDIEMGLFEFGKDRAATVYPQTTARFIHDFTQYSAQPSPFFSSLAKYLHARFHHYRIFHWICALTVITCTVLLFFSEDPVGLFFAINAVGTFLIFAYFNPHVPLRYLLQIIIPGYLAILIALRGRLRFIFSRSEFAKRTHLKSEIR